MPLFRFEPRPESLNHPDWSASTVKRICYAVAKDSKAAIDVVKRNTCIATSRGVKGQKIPTTPWGNPELVICIEAAELSVPLSDGQFWVDKGN